MVRRIVYLDHSVLSNLAKNPSTDLLEILTALVAADKALFPFSWTHHYEAELDSRIEEEYYRICAQLSRGVRFHPYAQIVALQVRDAYLSFISQEQPDSNWKQAYEHDPRGEISPRLAERMLSARVTTSAEGRDQRRAIKRLDADSLNAQKNAAMSSASYDAAVQKCAEEAVQFYFATPQNRALTGELDELDVPMLQFSGLVADAAYGITVPPRTVAEIFAGRKSMFEFLASDDCWSIPFIRLESSILASLDVDERSRRYSPGDFHDVQTWAAHIPYVDIAVTDKNMHQVLSRRGLAANFGCSVFPNTDKSLEDLISTLEAV